MFEGRTTKEKISHAMVTGNLKVSSNGVGDAEYLTAVGMAAQRVNPAASAVMRLHLANDKMVYKRIRREVIKEAERVNLRQGWRFVTDQILVVADQVMAHFIVPVCRKCQGQRYETIMDTPMLSGRHCRACGGTGVRPLMARYKKPIAGLLNWLERVEDELEAQVRWLVRPALA